VRRSTLLRSGISVAAITAVAAASAAALPAGATPTARATAAAQAAPARAVHLITGDTALVTRQHGRPDVRVLLRSHRGIAGQVSTFAANGSVYVIPGAARRYLDSVLDPSLFDVTAASAHAPRRMPVIVSVAHGSHAVVPGLTVTSRSATGERGYFSPAGARKFGAALDAQWRRDTLAHRTPGRLFGGVTHMAVPGATSPAPEFQQYTLRIRVIAPSGKPADFAFVGLTDVENGLKFTNFVAVTHGLAKISVPAGTYSGIAEYDRVSKAGVASYLVPVENVPVTGKKAHMVFDTRTATTVPSVSVPRPAQVVDESLEWDRNVPHTSISYSADFGQGGSVHVAPSGEATTGKLNWVTGWHLAGTSTSGEHYSYDLAYDDTGAVPADQSRTVTSGDVAELDSAYYSDQQSRLYYFGRNAVFPFQFFIITDLLPLPAPDLRTEYVNQPAGATWEASVITGANEEDPFQGFVDDADRTYEPGSTQQVDWLRGPLAPGASEPTPAEKFFFCGYCRDGRELALFFDPFDDTTPGHSGTLDASRFAPPVARFALYRNGQLVKQRRNATGGTFRIAAGDAQFRFVVHTEREYAGFASSTSATVSESFTSSSSDPAVPHTWECPGATKTCHVLPLIVADVPLPTDLQDVMPQGQQTFTFQVRHVTGAADTALSGVGLALTADGGKTYTPASVTPLGGDSYQATIDDPPAWADHQVGLRITASDSAGTSFTETVQSAYVVAES
jgi:hypothetical protein